MCIRDRIRIGDTRLDIWTGYAQYMRFLTQLSTSQRKATETGHLSETNRKDIVDRFIQSKLAPGAGLLNDILQGQTYIGEELILEGGAIASQAYQRLAPLAIQDIVDAVNTEGPVGGVVASPGFLGVGVVSYKQTPEQLFRQQKEAAYIEIENTVWSKYPPNYRNIAEESEKLKREDKYKAKRLLMQYPAIVMAMNKIEAEKERWLLQNKRALTAT